MSQREVVMLLTQYHSESVQVSKTGFLFSEAHLSWKKLQLVWPWACNEGIVGPKVLKKKN